MANWSENWTSTSYKLLFALLIFLVPSNLFLKLVLPQAYVHGLLVDYLLPKFYLSDLVILLLLSIWLGWEIIPNLKIKKLKSDLKKVFNKYGILFSGLIIILVTKQFLSSNPVASIWYLLKLFEMGTLAGFIYQNKKLLSNKITVGALFGTIFFQGLLALYQFFQQGSLWGYQLLGEPHLRSYFGIAKGVFNGVEKILPYGTTAHPNLLAGILVIYLILGNQLNKKLEDEQLLLASKVALALVFNVIYFTQSISAGLVFALWFGWEFLEKQRGSQLVKIRKTIRKKSWLILVLAMVLIPILLTQFLKNDQSTSIQRRVELNQATLEMFVKNPVIGVGLNNFTVHLEEYSQSREMVRFVQPVHHLGLLWLAETGLMGMGLVGGLFYLFFKSSYKKFLQTTIILVLLSPIITLDHYLLTQQSGLLSLVILSSLYIFDF